MFFPPDDPTDNPTPQLKIFMENKGTVDIEKKFINSEFILILRIRICLRETKYFSNKHEERFYVKMILIQGFLRVRNTPLFER